MSRARAPRWLWPAMGFGAVLVLLVLASLKMGTSTLVVHLSEALRGAGATFGLAEPLEYASQKIVELRCWRTLTAIGVGAGLGLSGAFVQGIFRNGLASPGVLGISPGASLGAITAIAIVGGYGNELLPVRTASLGGIVLIPVCAFAGALLVALIVYRLASRAGHVSIPALLLTGLALNTILGGVEQLAHNLLLANPEVSRSILVWSMGTLEDREAWHAIVALAGVAFASLVIPFTAYELDLMQAGLEDASALGVDVRRVKFLALAAASLAAACAVAVAGQIGFLGLVAPHLVRLTSGVSYRTLLPLSALCGAVCLLAADVASRALFQHVQVQPGVVLSLVGGPFFVWLLWRKRREIALW